MLGIDFFNETQLACNSILAISKSKWRPLWCHRDLGAADQNVTPSTPYLRIGLIYYRRHPVTPWCLSNHNQYMTATGHNPRCDLGLPSLSTLSLSLQRINIKLSPFCHLPIISTELTHLWCLRSVSWFKDSNEDNSAGGLYFYLCYHNEYHIPTSIVTASYSRQLLGSRWLIITNL